MGKIKALVIEDYIKETFEKIDAVTTSLNIERRHRDFLDRKNINLSKLVRDVLDQLMEGENNENQK